MHYVIILAAGSGKRFRKSTQLRIHKSLAPIWDHRGTLSLLLTNLRGLGVIGEQITLVTGFLSTEVLSEAQDIFPKINYYFNPTFETDSMFNSLQKALKAHTLITKPIWVLFADTLYTLTALDNMLKFQATTPAAALLCDGPNNEHSSKQDNTKQFGHLQAPPVQKELPVIVKNNIITTFNADPKCCTHVMAHAVYWPSSFLKKLVDAPKTATSQWQILQTIPNVTYLQLAPLSAQDIDTTEQLEQLRPRITESALTYFKQDLNKDQRSLQIPDRKEQATFNGKTQTYYIKQCESITAAAHEAFVLTLLHKQFPNNVPQVYHKDGCKLFTDLVSGIRLYDLLRFLHTNNSKHNIIRETLNARYNHQLSLQQGFLAKHKDQISNQPYPFQLKVTNLLEELCSLLRLPKPPSDELAVLEKLWVNYCSVPFRDATPKNIIIAATDAHIMQPAVKRKAALDKLLSNPISYWEQIDIIDIDYTSTYHLTSPMDDKISFNGHACNSNNNPYFSALFEKQHHELERDLALLVRYLRFGGRKLMYLLLNPIGYRHRFKYDDPTVYFSALPTLLSSHFQSSYPKLSYILRLLNNKAAQFKGFMPSQHAIDHFLQKSSEQPKYWQESPLESEAKINISNLVNL